MPPLPSLLSLPVVLLVAGGCAVPSSWPGTADAPVAPVASAAGQLAGTVRDASGAGVAGAFVTTEPGGVEVVADAAGAFEIARLAPGSYRVVAAAPGHAAGTSEVVEVRDAVASSVDVTLGVAPVVDGILRVRVVGPDGLALAGARVATDAGVEATTDAEGTAALPGLGGVTTTLTVTDAAGRLWPAVREGVVVPALGGADLALALTGRGGEGALHAGSTVCAYCHAEQAATWAGTAHARSMSAVEGEPADAFAAGLEVDLGGATAWLGTADGVPVVTLTDAAGLEDTWEVAGFIGGADRGAVPWAERDGVAYPLPVAWVAPEVERGDWDLAGWVASGVEPWIDAEGRLAYADRPDDAASAEAACFGCHVSGYTLSADDAGAVHMVGSTRTGARWDEAAVGCESCHGPGLDHTSGPLSEKLLSITNPDALPPARANEVCGQCHGALAGDAGTPYPWSETHGLFVAGATLADHAGSAFVGWPSGAAAVPGASWDELARSQHGTGAWSARCDDCHDPHGSAWDADLRLDQRDDALCTSCHLSRTFAGSETALEEHTAHVYAPTSDTESGRCTGCHMPPTAARLAWSDRTGAGDVASHRFLAIPPSDSLLAFDAAGADALPAGAFSPNACQACHAWNEWLFEGGFPGPAGDMTLRVTHEALQSAYEEKYP